MRGIYSSVTDIRRQVFTEVARMAYEGGDYSRVEELPYKILPGEVSKYRDSIFLERAIVGERLRLSMGLPLRPIDEHAPLSTGIEEAARPEKYYCLLYTSGVQRTQRRIQPILYQGALSGADRPLQHPTGRVSPPLHPADCRVG